MNEYLEHITPLTLYIITVISLSGFFLFYGVFQIKKAKNKRLKNAKSQDVSEAVETDAGDEDSESLMRRAALRSIVSRFDFIQKVYIPAIIILSIFLIAIPLLPTISASYVTLFAGVLAVLVGIAGKPLVENIISGMVLTFSQPIRINDTVIIDGRYGTVEKINLLYTTIKIWNWRRYIIPNNKLLQKEFENLSHGEEMEWAHINFFVAPDSDLELVKKLAKQSMRDCKYLKEEEEAPSFWVIAMNQDSIECWVAGWVAGPAEAWALRSKTRKNLIKNFSEAKIKFQMQNTNIKMDSSTQIPLNNQL